MSFFRSRRDEPDRVLHSHGPIAHQVKLLVYATLSLYVFLAVVIALFLIYYFSNSSKLSRLTSANRDAIVQLKAQDKLLSHQDAQLRGLAIQGVAAKRTNCAFRRSLEQQVKASRQYLADVAAGRRQRIVGITDSDIKAGIARQERVIAAYANLDCSPVRNGGA